MGFIFIQFGLDLKYSKIALKKDLIFDQSKDILRLRKSSVVVDASIVSTLFLRVSEGSSYSIHTGKVFSVFYMEFFKAIIANQRTVWNNDWL